MHVIIPSCLVALPVSTHDILERGIICFILSYPWYIWVVWVNDSPVVDTDVFDACTSFIVSYTSARLVIFYNCLHILISRKKCCALHLDLLLLEVADVHRSAKRFSHFITFVLRCDPFFSVVFYSASRWYAKILLPSHIRFVLTCCNKNHIINFSV